MQALRLALVLLSSSMLTRMVTAAWGQPSNVAAAGPIQRNIVNDLTPVLIDQLKAANISMLLVLPGPSKNHTSMKLDWRKVTESVEWLSYVHEYQDFLPKWQGYLKWHRSHHRPSSQTASGRKLAESKGMSSQVTPPRVALLVRGEDGTMRISQSTLAAAITGHLRRLQVVTLTYSTHQAKGDSLLVFDSTGVPLQANFLATSVFRDAFTTVYEQKHWTAEGGGSGPGSSVEFTANLRAFLPGLIQKYGISSMLDSSCGSMHWMPLVLKEVQQQKPEFKFMGTDVVCSLIDKHKQTYKDQPNMDFECVDYANQPLPSGYDLVFSRDSLQHIPMHGMWQLLNNVKASGAKYLLVGSYIQDKQSNTDIAAGGHFYPVDLLKEPFRVFKPLEIFDEKGEGKHMLLFDVQKMTWEDPLAGLV